VIYLDRRTGSAELFLPLQQRGVPVELTTLDYGDAVFAGKGPSGPVLIGIERKRVTDLLQSLQSGRLSGHQLPGLVSYHEYRWLLVEGQYRESPEGLLELPRRGKPWELVRFKYAALEGYLTTLTLRGGLHVQRTYDQNESAAWLVSLYRWWTTKDWAGHRSHLALHEADSSVGLWSKPTLAHRVAAQLPGIDAKAGAVARAFPTVIDIAAATEPQWTAIDGIGKVTARRIMAALQSPD
jgi:ERCC4-type nuclease